MELRQLEHFLAVVDEGGLGKAAEALYISQASVSASIRSLERELMVRLFHRTGRRLVPTSAGEELVPLARQVTDDVLGIQDAMRRNRELHGGVLTIACMPEVAGDAVATWSSGFVAKFPGVRLELTEVGSRNELVAAVADGRAELGFSVETESRADLSFIDLGKQRLLLVRPASHPLPVADDGRVRLTEIDDLPLVVRRLDGQENDEIYRALEAHGVSLHIGANVPSRTAQLTFVRRAPLQAFLPLRLCAGVIDSGFLLYETDPLIEARFGIVHRVGELAPTAQAFADEVQGALLAWHGELDSHLATGLGLVDAVRASRHLTL